MLKYEHLTAGQVAHFHRKCFHRFYFRWAYLRENAGLLWPALQRLGIGRLAKAAAEADAPHAGRAPAAGRRRLAPSQRTPPRRRPSPRQRRRQDQRPPRRFVGRRDARTPCDRLLGWQLHCHPEATVQLSPQRRKRQVGNLPTPGATPRLRDRVDPGTCLRVGQQNARFARRVTRGPLLSCGPVLVNRIRTDLPLWCITSSIGTAHIIHSRNRLPSLLGDADSSPCCDLVVRIFFAP